MQKKEKDLRHKIPGFIPCLSRLRQPPVVTISYWDHRKKLQVVELCVFIVFAPAFWLQSPTRCPIMGGEPICYGIAWGCEAPESFSTSDVQCFCLAFSCLVSYCYPFLPFPFLDISLSQSSTESDSRVQLGISERISIRIFCTHDLDDQLPTRAGYRASADLFRKRGVVRLMVASFPASFFGLFSACCTYGTCDAKLISRLDLLDWMFYSTMGYNDQHIVDYTPPLYPVKREENDCRRKE